MKGITFAAAAALAMLATPALAQTGSADLEGFNGFYLGLAGGYDVQSGEKGTAVAFDRNLDGQFGDSVLTGTGANAFAPGFCNGRAFDRLSPAAGGRCAKDKDGIAIYGRLGFDIQRGRAVFGVVGEFGTSEITDGVTAFSSTPASYVFNRGIDWEGGVRARAGFTPNNRTLLYGTVGPGYARIDRSFRSSQSTNTFIGRGKRNQFGIQGGGGVEQRFGSKLTLGIEYLFHQYKDDAFRVRAGGAAGTPFTNAANGGNVSGTDFRRTDEQFRWHSIRATMGFRF
jgi:outer membrane immunogenic protein